MAKVTEGSALEPESQVEKVARVTNKVLRVLTYAFFVCLLAVVLWFVISDQKELAQLAREGRAVSGQITGKHMEYSRRGSNRYYFDYEFTAAGQIVTGVYDISEDRYAHLPTDRSLTITYLPALPSVQRVGIVNEATVARARLGGGLMFSILLLFFGGVMWYIARH